MYRFIFFTSFIIWATTTWGQKATYQIGVLLDTRTEKADFLLTELQAQIKAVVGEDAVVQFMEEHILTNQYDIAQAAQQYQQLLSNETDLILAFGAVNYQMLATKSVYPKPTILFGGINQDLSVINLDTETTNIPNFYYLVEQESYKNDLTQLKTLTQFEQVGIAVRKDILSSLPLTTTFDKLLADLDAEYRFIPFEQAADITANLSGIDAVYFIDGFFFSPKEIKSIATTLNKLKIPSFTINGIEQVKNGLMATNQPDDNTAVIIRRLALTVEQFINGTPLSSMPVWLHYQPQLTVNYNTALVTNTPIKLSLISEADLVGNVGDLNAAKQYTLPEVIETALNKNLTLQAEKKQVDLSGQAIQLAKSAYLPNVSVAANAAYTDPELAVLTFGQNPEFQSYGNVTVQQNIFSPRANANIAIQENSFLAQQEKFNAEQLNTIFEVATAYFDILILKSNAQIQLRNLAVTKKNYQIAVRNYEAGMTGKTDMLRFRSQIAQNTQALVEASGDLRHGLIRLNQLMNLPNTAIVDVQPIELNDPLFNAYPYGDIKSLVDDPLLSKAFTQFVIQEGQKNAPELKALAFQQKMVDRSLMLNEKARFLPTVTMQGQFNTLYTRGGAGSTAPEGMALPNSNYVVGVQASLPIFNQNLSKLRKQNALIQKDQNQILVNNSKQSIAVNAQNAILTLTNNVSNIELSKISEETAEEALVLTQVNYLSGATNSVQLIDAQVNLLNAQLRKATAVHHYWQSILLVERTIGHFFLLHPAKDNNQLKERLLHFLNPQK